MGVNNTGPMMGGGARPPAYSPPAGTASGIPGASYPVMGSMPASNMQPRLGSPGGAQMQRPGMQGPPPGIPNGPPQAGTAPGGMPPQGMARPMAPGAQGANPQQLATALSTLGGGAR